MSDTSAEQVTNDSTQSSTQSVVPAQKMYVFPYETKLAQISEQLAEGKTPTSSPRELLAWFHSYRRGSNVVAWIRSELRKRGIVTVPDFEFEFIDGLITFYLHAESPADAKPKVDTQPGETSTPAKLAVVEESNSSEPAITTDPTYRIGKLAAANQRLVSVAPDASINRLSLS